MDLEKLIEEKNKTITNTEDRKKMDVINGLIKNPNWVFRLDANIVMNILEFLGVPKNEVKDYYLKLISINNYVSNNQKVYTLIDSEEDNQILQ